VTDCSDQVIARRANYIGAPQMFNLSQACRVLVDAFGPCVYLVGSSLERRDYRDVDIRCILDDTDFARLFPGANPNDPSRDALWSLMSSAVSLYLSQHSGLPVDFQIQQMKAANATYPGARSAIGIFLEPQTVCAKRVMP
jgi:hypothetical protein